MLVSDENLERLNWTGHSGPDINPVPAAIASEMVGDELEVDVVATAAFGGALVSLDRPVPVVNGQPLPWLKVVWQVTPSPAAVQAGRCDELDAILVFPAAPAAATPVVNRYDGSTQLNLAEGGMWQIDNADEQWIDTGAKPGPLPAGQPTRISTIYHYDFAAQTMAVVSIAQGDAAPFLVATAEQGIAAHSSNWSLPGTKPPQPVLHLQIQLDDNNIPAGFEVHYRCSVYWSDNPNFQ